LKLYCAAALHGHVTSILKLEKFDSRVAFLA
jgi:hypothetical protein